MHRKKQRRSRIVEFNDEISRELNAAVWLKQTGEDISDLETPGWSVVSFHRVEANRLTYRAALKKMAQLESLGVSGLCVITGDAAGRIKSRPDPPETTIPPAAAAEPAMHDRQWRKAA